MERLYDGYGIHKAKSKIKRSPKTKRGNYKAIAYKTFIKYQIHSISQIRGLAILASALLKQGKSGKII